ncbi:carboxypeptidase regulatory-like domain-containing protein [Pyxidicoccus fallax]|uniref:Carboxypeptidase regulatory-like domain-containing protein n=1 Tax=Pyxidicoccus fallax TaxID=394095 RepID=A0A848LDB0_9BACT|nr:carboxypeptidase-like regulatory domain-containing protein [Pyxidicoccus fallax]NMO16436.1 carboxypeptidase regulatory-like domain-containing protein [Pyxidicoccus fallax]NPC86363.1 carboxypeptidase regulatory-like domain-containing protein [Pyxidicoccus fallax]
MKKHLVFAVVPFLALGCGEDLKDENGDGIADGVREPDSVTVVTPATPKGTVSGQVLSTDLKPLSEVVVEMTIGSSAEPVSVPTDAKGNFEFPGVPAGSEVLLTFSKAGYATLRATSTVPSSAGNVPINNANASFGPITLAKLDGTMSFIVVTPQGRPAANARATLEAAPAGSIILFNGENATRVVSNVVVEAIADEQGVLTFSGIPSAAEMARLQNGAYRLWVSPVDTNNDALPDTTGYAATYSGQTAVQNTSTRLINLQFARDNQGAALNVESSNVGSLRGATDRDPLRNMIGAGDPIYLFFSQPVQQGSLLARLTDEAGRESLAVTTSIGAGGYSATIRPSNGLQPGREYNIDVRAVSAEGGSLYTKTGYFFTGEPANAQAITISEVRYQETSTSSPTSSQINPGERIYVNFSSPIARTYDFGPYVQVFIDANIADASATSVNVIGDVAGELNNPVGLDLFMDEPSAPLQTRTPAEVAPFPMIYSGYSTRYSFFYNGAFPLSPTSLRVHVAFDKLANRPAGGTTGTYESIWGQPITANLSVSTVATQPPPAQ